MTSTQSGSWIAGEIIEVGARPEAEVRVVGADFFVPGRHDEHLARELLRDRAPAGGEALATGQRRDAVRLGAAHDWVMNASNSAGVPLSWAAALARLVHLHAAHLLHEKAEGPGTLATR